MTLGEIYERVAFDLEEGSLRAVPGALTGANDAPL